MLPPYQMGRPTAQWDLHDDDDTKTTVNPVIGEGAVGRGQDGRRLAKKQASRHATAEDASRGRKTSTAERFSSTK
jgi:hypothetical protein